MADEASDHLAAEFRADLASLREQVTSALDRSMDRCARCKVCDAQVDAAMAAIGAEFDRLHSALEHAQSAAAGSHQGIRLWMLDCGELVQKHREHAVEASARLGEQRARAEEAEAKLAAGDALIRQILEAACRRDGLPLESSAVPGEPARNYELAMRLGIGRVFGIGSGEAGRA